MVQLTKENLIYIGASGTIAVAALALIGSSIFSGATTEGLEITSSSLKKASNNAVLNVQVRNSGTSEIESLLVTINDITLTGTTLSSTDFGIVDIPRAHPAHPGVTPLGTGSYNATNPCSGGCDLAFTNPTPQDISAGQTISFSGALPGSGNLNVGDSYVIVIEGVIDGSTITNTAVVTVTRF